MQMAARLVKQLYSTEPKQLDNRMRRKLIDIPVITLVRYASTTINVVEANPPK